MIWLIIHLSIFWLWLNLLPRAVKQFSTSKKQKKGNGVIVCMLGLFACCVALGVCACNCLFTVHQHIFK